MHRLHHLRRFHYLRCHPPPQSPQKTALLKLNSLSPRFSGPSPHSRPRELLPIDRCASRNARLPEEPHAPSLASLCPFFALPSRTINQFRANQRKRNELGKGTFRVTCLAELWVCFALPACHGVTASILHQNHMRQPARRQQPARTLHGRFFGIVFS